MAALNPECRDGKHGNCDGRALDETTDQVVPCEDSCHDPNPYTEGYWERGEGSNYRGYGDDAGWAPIARTLRAHMTGHAPGREKMLLELGCASGYFVRAARAEGFNAWGIDLSPYAIDHAPADVSEFVQVGSATALGSIGTGTQDVVCSWEMLEHLNQQQIVEAVLGMWRVLGPGGIFVHKIALGTDGIPGYEDIPFHDARGDATHITLELPEWWRATFDALELIRDQGLEDDLNASFVGRDWHNRFFAYRKAGNPS